MSSDEISPEKWSKLWMSTKACAKGEIMQTEKLTKKAFFRTETK